MKSDSVHDRGVPGEPARRILVILPNDGSDRRLIKALRHDKGVTRAVTVPVRAIAALQQAKTKSARLPEPALAKLVTVVVTEMEADDVFDFIYSSANIHRPGGGRVMLERLLAATPYVLPADLLNEPD